MCPMPYYEAVERRWALSAHYRHILSAKAVVDTGLTRKRQEAFHYRRNPRLAYSITGDSVAQRSVLSVDLMDRNSRAFTNTFPRLLKNNDANSKIRNTRDYQPAWEPITQEELNAIELPEEPGPQTNEKNMEPQPEPSQPKPENHKQPTKPLKPPTHPPRPHAQISVPQPDDALFYDFVARVTADIIERRAFDQKNLERLVQFHVDVRSSMGFNRNLLQTCADRLLSRLLYMPQQELVTERRDVALMPRVVFEELQVDEELDRGDTGRSQASAYSLAEEDISNILHDRYDYLIKRMANNQLRKEQSYGDEFEEDKSEGQSSSKGSSKSNSVGSAEPVIQSASSSARSADSVKSSKAAKAAKLLSPATSVVEQPATVESRRGSSARESRRSLKSSPPASLPLTPHSPKPPDSLSLHSPPPLPSPSVSQDSLDASNARDRFMDSYHKSMDLGDVDPDSEDTASDSAVPPQPAAEFNLDELKALLEQTSQYFDTYETLEGQVSNPGDLEAIAEETEPSHSNSDVDLPSGSGSTVSGHSSVRTA